MPVKKVSKWTTMTAVAALLSAFVGLAPAHANSTAAIRWVPTQSTGYAWWLDNKLANDPNNFNNFQIYYTPKVKLYDVIAANGATVNIKWLVTDVSGVPLKNKPVTLVINPAYTYPTATLSNPILNPKKNYPSGTDRDPTKADNANINLTTDANGYVSYSITNNTSVEDSEPLMSDDGVTLPPAGSSIFTQLQLYVGTFTQGVDGYEARKPAQLSQDIDILEIHWQLGAVKGSKIAAATDTPPANVIRWNEKASSGALWSTTNKAALQSILKGEYFTPKVNFFDVFAKFGTSMKLSWRVTDPKGKALANAPVTLILNPAYSGGTANVTDMNSKQVPLAYSGAQDGVNIQLVTDANGNVTYTLQNNDTAETAEAPPFDKSSPPTGSVYLQALLYTGTYANYAARTPSWSVQKIQDLDILEVHFVTGLPVATTGTTGGTAGGGIQPSGGVGPTGPIDTSDKNDAPVVFGDNKVPKNVAAPSLPKIAKIGSEISASLGKWSYSGNASATITWYRCKSAGSVAKKLPAGCLKLPVVSGSKISVVSSLKGYYLRAAVTQKNPAGSTTVFTATSGQVK
jgi:hypothetical protein